MQTWGADGGRGDVLGASERCGWFVKDKMSAAQRLFEVGRLEL